mmetsp:Transcript_58055/g.155109  ORF Transcript_58055/g.155109 Transcript_58055/m.155109 type:complete len:221 (-) Transcript_58055:401-1063(-)
MSGIADSTGCGSCASAACRKATSSVVSSVVPRAAAWRARPASTDNTASSTRRRWTSWAAASAARLAAAIASGCAEATAASAAAAAAAGLSGRELPKRSVPLASGCGPVVLGLRLSPSPRSRSRPRSRLRLRWRPPSRVSSRPSLPRECRSLCAGLSVAGWSLVDFLTVPLSSASSRRSSRCCLPSRLSSRSSLCALCSEDFLSTRASSSRAFLSSLRSAL